LWDRGASCVIEACMARPACEIELSPEVCHALESVAWSELQPSRAVVRARLILMAVGGATNDAISRELGLTH
jgi:hypothetical protein